jgi:hypothetical protein
MIVANLAIAGWTGPIKLTHEIIASTNVADCMKWEDLAQVEDQEACTKFTKEHEHEMIIIPGGTLVFISEGAPLGCRGIRIKGNTTTYYIPLHFTHETSMIAD